LPEIVGLIEPKPGENSPFSGGRSDAIMPPASQRELLPIDTVCANLRQEVVTPIVTAV
jgi:hypothetical protein